MEKQPTNILEVKLTKLTQRRLQLKQELAEIDREIGQIDILISKSKNQASYDLNYEPVDLDIDSMYRPSRVKAPPYDLLLQ